MNSVTKDKLNFIINSAPFTKERMTIDGTIVEVSNLTVTNVRYLTLNKYRSYVQEVLNKKYETFFRGLALDFEYKNKTDHFIIIVRTWFKK